MGLRLTERTVKARGRKPRKNHLVLQVESYVKGQLPIHVKYFKLKTLNEGSEPDGLADAAQGVYNPPPPPKFRSFAKAEPNSQFRGIYIHKNVIRIWASFICKLSGTPD
jgi:hypothetical protein